MYEVLTAPVFQSTHPARGATSALIKDGQNAGISIHAPREGCDQKVLTVLRVAVEISIHAPREGCDCYTVADFAAEHPISIHAPREGCDMSTSFGTEDAR